MDKDLFYLEIGQSLFNGRLSSGQQDGIEVKIEAFDRHGIADERWRAYMLATSYHETACTMQPVEEMGKGKGKPYGEKRKYDGTAYSHPDKLYFGRGDVQLTWYENYKKMGTLLGIPLLTYPELALDPDISASIMIEGMTQGISDRGDFTGVSLENYFNHRKEDPVNARRVVNGLDQAHRIAEYYRRFLAALRIAMVFTLLLVMGCKSGQIVTEKMVTRTDSTAVQESRDSLWTQERESAVLQTRMHRVREEMTRLGSVMRQHHIQYDTTLPVDSVTGKPPMASETLICTRLHYGTEVEDEERRYGERVGGRESTIVAQRSETLVVEKQIQEEKERVEKSPAPRWKQRLRWAAVVTVVVFAVYSFLRRCTGRRLK